MTAARWLRASLALVLMALGLLPTRCLASEDFQPFLEGTTTGTPVGALPGPGLYLTEHAGNC